MDRSRASILNLALGILQNSNIQRWELGIGRQQRGLLPEAGKLGRFTVCFQYDTKGPAELTAKWYHGSRHSQKVCPSIILYFGQRLSRESSLPCVKC